MYTLSEKEIKFIHDDITSRGIEMESIRDSLIDHVCCIIEQKLEADGNFEEFYDETIKTFYKTELKEIEEETKLILTFKNHYTMKKIMFVSGGYTVFAFIIGSIFKLMAWPGVSPLIVSALAVASFIFLPSIFIIKSRELQLKRDKWIFAVGIFSATLFCIGVMFKFQHWPAANILWLTSIAIVILIFSPLYFFSGIKKKESKINTVITTIIIIVITGIQFSLINIHPAKKQALIKMHSYIQNDMILSKLNENYILLNKGRKQDITLNQIQSLCSQVKQRIIRNSMGVNGIPTDFEEKNMLLEEGNLGYDFHEGEGGERLISQLRQLIIKYNGSAENNKIQVDHTILDTNDDNLGSYSNYLMLNCLTQLQIQLTESSLDDFIRKI